MNIVYGNTGSTLAWPTRRLATWAKNNNITTQAELQSWLTANVTTLAQARAVLLELCFAMASLANEGE